MISNKTTNYNYIFVVLLDIKKVFVFLVPPVGNTVLFKVSDISAQGHHNLINLLTNPGMYQIVRG